jgi:hypothetical protein
MLEQTKLRVRFRVKDGGLTKGRDESVNSATIALDNRGMVDIDKMMYCRMQIVDLWSEFGGRWSLSQEFGRNDSLIAAAPENSLTVAHERTAQRCVPGSRFFGFPVTAVPHAVSFSDRRKVRR